MGQRPILKRVFFLLAFSFALAVSKEKAVCEIEFLMIFATFLGKGSAKNFHTGKFLSHIVRSTIKSAMFAPHQMFRFLLRFFLKKRMGFGATPHKLNVKRVHNL